MRVTVRNMGSGVTHLADVESTSAAVAFKAPYRAVPSSSRSLCGVHIKDGVVMPDKTRVKCAGCRYLAEQERDRREANPLELREQEVRAVIEERLAYSIDKVDRDALGTAIMNRLRAIE